MALAGLVTGAKVANGALAGQVVMGGILSSTALDHLLVGLPGFGL